MKHFAMKEDSTLNPWFEELNDEDKVKVRQLIEVQRIQGNNVLLCESPAQQNSQFERLSVRS